MKTKTPAFPMEVSCGSVSAKIYKVENKSYSRVTQSGRVVQKPRFSFYVSYFAGGKRWQKMFAAFDEAKAWALSSVQKLSVGEHDALHLRAEDARAYVNATQLIQRTGIPLEVIAKEYMEAWAALGGRASIVEAAREYAHRHQQNMPKKTVPQAVDEMIALREKDGTSDAYLKVLRAHLGHFKAACQNNLTSLTSTMLRDYFQSLPVSARTKNNARATIGAFLKFCKQSGWLPRDHEGITDVPKLKDRGSEVIEIYSPKEFSEILAVARPEMIPFLTIGAFSGLRTAEIERLDWSEIHLKERFIEIKAAKAKTASRRLAQVPENLAKWLEPYQKERGLVWNFENSAKQIGWLMEDVTEARAMAALHKAAEKLGRADWEQKDLEGAHKTRLKKERTAFAKRREKALKEGHKAPDEPFEEVTELPDGTEVAYQRAEWKRNALRHSYISYRVAEINDVAKVALEAGNSAQIIFQHYRELVRPDDAKAWFGILPVSKIPESPLIPAIPG